MNWLISANAKLYDHERSFNDFNYIDWHQGNYKFATGDVIYIYCTSPIQRIRYRGYVERINLSFDEIRDDKEYWNDLSAYNQSKDWKYMHLVSTNVIDNDMLSLANLKKHGLKAAPQSPKKLSGELLDYIESCFIEGDNYFPEEIGAGNEIYEGHKKTVTVNKFERSKTARDECVKYFGCKCSICGFNFEKVYGEVGKDYIHVHHIRPIHEIGKEYKINYKDDLIPVCPNCHAMLHKKVNGETLSIELLKEKFR
jgi:5-methylcytosine-specific restriction protein A